MDTRTGEIRSAAEVLALPPEERAFYRPMTLPPTPLQAARRRVGRNHPCPCGSGQKFKQCCLVRPRRRG